MTTTALKSLLKEQPFRPFSIVISSGDKYPVRHPENILILKDRAVVAVESDVIDEDPEDTVTISFLHIAATEPLPERKFPKGFPK